MEWGLIILALFGCSHATQNQIIGSNIVENILESEALEVETSLAAREAYSEDNIGKTVGPYIIEESKEVYRGNIQHEKDGERYQIIITGEAYYNHQSEFLFYSQCYIKLFDSDLKELQSISLRSDKLRSIEFMDINEDGYIDMILDIWGGEHEKYETFIWGTYSRNYVYYSSEYLVQPEKDGETYAISIMAEPYWVDSIKSYRSNYKFKLVDSEANELQFLSLDEYDVVGDITFEDVNFDGYSDIVLYIGGTVNEAHALYIWNPSKRNFTKVIYEGFEMLAWYEIREGHIENFVRGGTPDESTKEILVWDGDVLRKEKTVGEDNESQEDGKAAFTEERELYYRYIENELIPKYGLASLDPVQGFLSNEDGSAWFQPGGIVSAYIDDLDHDGKAELLLFYFKEKESSKGKGQIYSTFNLYAAVFELKNGTPYQLDETKLHAYNGREISIASNHWIKTNLFISSVIVNGNQYIMIEFLESAAVFAELGYSNYWGIELVDDQIKFAFSFSQDEDPRTDVDTKFMEYRFEKGSLFSERQGDLTDGFKLMLNNFFDSLGIVATYEADNKSILEANRDRKKILSYQFDGKYPEDMAGTIDESVVYIFTLLASDHTNLRNEIKNLD